MFNEIEAKSILRKRKKIDSWFLSRYGMNPYKGCEHDCVYCDGRAEGYYVEGEFGKDIAVKINILEVLEKELKTQGKRKPLKPAFTMIGSGIGDSYQPAERKYNLTRKSLELLSEHNRPVHILTKSILVERDTDVITEINKKSGAIVSFSFSSMDDEISRLFEPGVPPPSARLETIKRLKGHGISCGMFLMPVIPFMTDTEEQIRRSVEEAKKAGIDFIIFGGMTLKNGRQSYHFYEFLEDHYPGLVEKYRDIYKENKWGAAGGGYYASINRLFHRIARESGMPVRIPLRLFRDMLCENDLVVVLLEHMDYFLKAEGRSSSFGYAAYSVSMLDKPLSEMKGDIRKIRGIGDAAERIIGEILEKRTSSYYEKLAPGGWS